MVVAILVIFASAFTVVCAAVSAAAAVAAAAAVVILENIRDELHVISHHYIICCMIKIRSQIFLDKHSQGGVSLLSVPDNGHDTGLKVCCPSGTVSR